MSREQRRSERRQQTRGTTTPARASKSAAAPPSRRTPVRVAGGGRFPVVPIAIVGGVAAVVLLIVYLIIQAQAEEGLTAWQKAEQDADPNKPGLFFATQGRGHFPGGLVGHEMTPFCEGVAQSDLARQTHIGGQPVPTLDPNATPAGTSTTAATNTPAATPTPAATGTGTAASGTAGGGSPEATPTVPSDCFTTNPPSSGRHLNVQRGIEVQPGVVYNIPPDPNVYDPDIEIPRDAIPHLLEHAGVFVGYNCEDGDQACQEVVERLSDLVDDRIENHDDRVVLARDTDLPVGTIGASSWTRVLNMRYEDYDEDAVRDFIGTHSCRFDPEGIC